MFDQVSNLAKADVFYLITFASALLLAIFGQGLGIWLILATMFTPLLAVLIMLLVVTADGYMQSTWGSLGLLRLGWKSWGLAVLAPLLVMPFTYSIV